MEARANFRGPSFKVLVAALGIASLGLWGSGCDRERERDGRVPSSEEDRGGATVAQPEAGQQPDAVQPEGRNQAPRSGGMAHQKKKKKRALTPEERREREGTTSREPAPSPESRGPAVRPKVDERISALSKKEMLCPESPHAHPRFMRSDLAYSITGIDCFGDVPGSYRVNVGAPAGARAPASQSRCDSNPHSHPLWMRADIAWDITRLDCQGDPPASRGSSSSP